MPFQCYLCNREFLQKCAMNIHTCQKSRCCNKFSQSCHLITHLTTHFGEKQYRCGTCSKTFSRIGNLKCHEKTHTAKKLYTCHLCNAEFTNRYYLDIHVRTHTGEKPFKCNTFDKALVHKKLLECHVGTYTGEKTHKCNICSNIFPQKHHLDAHLRTHTEEQPYKCNVCSKEFFGTDVIMSHLRSHTAEKPQDYQFTNQRFTHMDVHNYRVNCGVKQNTNHIPVNALIGDTASYAEENISCRYVGSCLPERRDKGTSRKIIRIHSSKYSRYIQNPFAENHFNGSISHKTSSHTNDLTGEKPQKCNFFQNVFSARSSLRGHFETHNSEKSKKFLLPDIAVTQPDGLSCHIITAHCMEKRYIFFQSSFLRKTERHNGPASSKSLTKYASDENLKVNKLDELPTTESQDFSSYPSHCVNPAFGLISINTADVNSFVVRTYGCGVCDEMFEIEKEFIEHCYNHCT